MVETNQRKAEVFRRAMAAGSETFVRTNLTTIPQRSDLRITIQKIQLDIDALDKLMLSQRENEPNEVKDTQIKKVARGKGTRVGKLDSNRGGTSMSTLVVGHRTYMTKAELRAAIKEKIVWFQRNPGERSALRRRVDDARLVKESKLGTLHAIRDNAKRAGTLDKERVRADLRAVARKEQSRCESQMERRKAIDVEYERKRAELGNRSDLLIEQARERYRYLKMRALPPQEQSPQGALNPGDVDVQEAERRALEEETELASFKKRIWEGDVEASRQMLSEKPALAVAVNDDGITALEHAALTGHTAMATMLVTANPQCVNIRGKGLNTALMRAAENGLHRCLHGWSPKGGSFCVFAGFMPIVQLLCTNGADLNLQVNLLLKIQNIKM